MKKWLGVVLGTAAAFFFTTGCTTINTSDGAESLALPETVSTGYQEYYTHKDQRVSGEGNVNVLFVGIGWVCGQFGSLLIQFFPVPVQLCQECGGVRCLPEEWSGYAARDALQADDDRLFCIQAGQM